MLSFSNHEYNEKAKEYIEEIKNSSKDLNKESQDFIKTLFDLGNQDTILLFMAMLIFSLNKHQKV